MKDIKEFILKHALKNALDFGGKVNSKVILGTVLKEMPELKSDVPAILKAIEVVSTSIEGKSSSDLREQLLTVAPELLVQKKVESVGPLKALVGAVKGNFVVRIAPSPSGPLHIGHAYGTSLNYEYAKMYGGKLILRVEDTNPENIYPSAYELIERDARWLTDDGLEPEVVVQSSRLGMYYDYVEKLVVMGRGYICTCDADVWRELKNKGRGCPCRELSVANTKTRWAKMFGEYAEGEAVVRLKTDIADKNPAMRDFAIMRIVEHVHPKTEKSQRLWPLMIFSVAIDDHEMGVTHVLNGKDHADNAIKEQMIMGFFGWKAPEYRHWGRINFEGFELSTSKTRIAIEQGVYNGWEDIRLPFLPALRKRGYQPGAFRRFALEIGLSLSDKTVLISEFWKNINAFNKEILDPKSRRAFFVLNPVKVQMGGKVASMDTHVPVHPSFPERGERVFALGSEVYLAADDVSRLSEGKIHRLIDGYNFTVSKGKFMFHSKSYEEYKNSLQKGLIIHYLPVEMAGLVNVSVCLIDGSVDNGLGEPALGNLKVGEIVQFERCYFARLDSRKGDTLTFWYLHE